MHVLPDADPAIPTHPAGAVVRHLAEALGLGSDPSRIYGLDILRAVAITDVVVQHGSNLLPPGPAAVVRSLNLDGVSMFFVLSGFLVGGILVRLFESHRAGVGLVLQFWIRRWFRTLPAYYVVLLLLCGLNTLSTPGFHPASTARYFVFAQNLRSPHPWFFPEAWSLCVEEWFYLLVPVIVLLQIRLGGLSPRAAITGTALIIIVSCTSFRAWRHATIDVHSLGEWDDLFRKQVVTRLDSLMFGVLAAAISIHHRRAWVARKWQAFRCGLGLMALGQGAAWLQAIPVGGTFSTVFSFTWASLSTALLLPLLSEYRHGRGFVYRAVTSVSLVSYSLYLLNLSVVQFWILGRRNAPPPTGDDLFAVAAMQVAYHVILLVLSVLMYRCVELPLMRWRDHPWLSWQLPRRQGGGSLSGEESRP